MKWSGSIHETQNNTVYTLNCKKVLTDLETIVGGAPLGRNIYAPEACKTDHFKY